VKLDRVLVSGLPRTVETARIVAPEHEPEAWAELREIRGGRLGDVPDTELEALFTEAFVGQAPLEARFLGGESLGALVDRVVDAVARFEADPAWDTALAVLHGGVNRAILSYALTGERRFLGSFEQAPGCINVLDLGDGGWIVRAVNVTPSDLLHLRTRSTTMEELWAEYAQHHHGP
jgi:broad specificity phosphatase PhoE